MNYRAHIPGAIAMASFGAFVVSAPLSLPYLIGAAIGGALPDIDQTNSAVNTMASRATDVVSRSSVLPRAAKSILGALGIIFDTIFVKPLGKIWRAFARGPFFKAYRRISSSSLGKKLKMQQVKTASDVAGHRGGATHSINFMIITSVPILPICLFLNALPFWIGLEIGIFAHLVADAMCLSGVKFFWPWSPKIGFQRAPSVGNNGGGQKGRDIRIMPKQLQMKTGAETEYANLESRDPDRKMKKHFVKLEKWYRRIFKLLAVVFIGLVLAGIGPGSGQVLFMGKIIPITKAGVVSTVQTVDNSTSANTGQQAAQNTDTTTPVTVKQDGSTSFSDVDDVNNRDGKAASTTNLSETLGPTSLTYGDISADSLPKGVYKLPDESLWIIGVGPVTPENLDKSPYNFSSADKDRMLQAMQDLRTKPNSTKNSSSDSSQQSTQENGKDDSLFGQIFGGSGGWSIWGSGNTTINIDGGDGIFGFHGLTPYTGGK